MQKTLATTLSQIPLGIVLLKILPPLNKILYFISISVFPQHLYTQLIAIHSSATALFCFVLLLNTALHCYMQTLFSACCSYSTPCAHRHTIYKKQNCFFPSSNFFFLFWKIFFWKTTPLCSRDKFRPKTLSSNCTSILGIVLLKTPPTLQFCIWFFKISIFLFFKWRAALYSSVQLHGVLYAALHCSCTQLVCCSLQLQGPLYTNRLLGSRGDFFNFFYFFDAFLLLSFCFPRILYCMFANVWQCMDGFGKLQPNKTKNDQNFEKCFFCCQLYTFSATSL